MNPFEKTFLATQEKKEIFTVSPALQKATEEALANIATQKATIRKYNDTGMRFSKRITLGKQEDIIPLLCERTGAVMGLLSPTIPGKTLLYRSPFATLAVCKDIANEGYAYLNRLDTSILAAIAITLAAEHSLFAYAVDDTGIQKNAVLRTVPRNMLINAIVLLAGSITYANAKYFPALSVIVDEEVETNGIRIRMQNWLSILRDRLDKAAERASNSRSEEEEEFSEYTAPKKSITPNTHAKAAKEKALLRKNFKEWRKASKDHIVTMHKAGNISLKLKNFLFAVMESETTIITADAEIIELMAVKLEQLNILAASNIALGLRKFHKLFYTGLEEVVEAPNFSSKPIGVYSTDQEEESEFSEFNTPREATKQLTLTSKSNTDYMHFTKRAIDKLPASTGSTIHSLLDLSLTSASEATTAVKGRTFAEILAAKKGLPAPTIAQAKPKSFMEKLLEKKLLEAQKTQTIDPSKENDNDAPF